MTTRFTFKMVPAGFVAFIAAVPFGTGAVPSVEVHPGDQITVAAKNLKTDASGRKIA